MSLVILVLASSVMLGQKRITVSGFAEDHRSRERLIGVNVFDESKKFGTVTNVYGFFSLTVPEGTTTIYFSYIGYNLQQLTISGTRDTMVTLELAESDIELDEAVVTGKTPAAQQSQMSSVELNIKQAKKIPAIFGEVDILRVMQYMPVYSRDQWPVWACTFAVAVPTRILYF